MYNCTVAPGDRVRINDIDMDGKNISDMVVVDGQVSVSLPAGRYVMCVRGEDNLYNKEFSVGTDEEIREKMKALGIKLTGTMTSKGTNYNCPNSDCNFMTMDRAILLSHSIKHTRRETERKQAEAKAEQAMKDAKGKAESEEALKTPSLADALNEE
jgi:cell division protein ZapA (FtsZ GTPase activity inhibitor)